MQCCVHSQSGTKFSYISRHLFYFGTSFIFPSFCSHRFQFLEFDQHFYAVVNIHESKCHFNILYVLNFFPDFLSILNFWNFNKFLQICKWTQYRRYLNTNECVLWQNTNFPYKCHSKATNFIWVYFWTNF